jgi:hypothetical protein
VSFFAPERGRGFSGMSTGSHTEGYSTVHHLPFERQNARRKFAYGDAKPSESLLESIYTPAETILGITDPEQAYQQAQGFVVNKQQNAIHAVRSACPGDIIEVVYPDGAHEFYFVDPIGFDKLPFEKPLDTTTEQTPAGGKPAL